MYKAQSLGSSLIHTIPAPHQRLPCLEDTALLFTRYQPPHHSGLPCVEDTLSFTWYQPHISGCHVWKTLLSYSHDTSPTSAAAVFGRHCSFIHTIPASHQRLPCVEDSALSLIQGNMEPLLQSLTHSPVVKRPPASERQWVILWNGVQKRGVTWCPCAEKRVKARSHLMPLRGKAREGEESPGAPAWKSAQRRGVTWCPCAENSANAISHLVPLRGKACEGGESPDAPAQKSVRRRGVNWCPGAHPISLQVFAGLLRQLFV